jgi:hypothetical protein
LRVIQPIIYHLHTKSVLSFSYSYFSDIFITRKRREVFLKVIRCYASQENALNARTIIQDLLVSELDRIIDQSSNEKSLLDKKDQIGSECA